MHSARKVTVATYLQPGFGALPAGGAINGILVPKRKSGTKATRSREEIENDTSYEDGFARRDGLGDYKNEQSWDIVPNLDYMPYPQQLFCGGADAPVDNGDLTFTRTRVLSQVMNVLMIEEGYPLLATPEYWQHKDHVLHKLSIKYALNSLLTMSGTSTGSGNWTKAGAPLDASYAKIEGSPCDFSEASISHGGAALHVIDLSLDIERVVAWCRDSEGAGKATSAMYDSFTGSGSFTVYKKTDKAGLLEEAAHSATATLVELKLLYQKGSKLTQWRAPEIQIFATDGVDNSDGEGSKQTFNFKVKKEAGIGFEWKTVSGLAAVA